MREYKLIAHRGSHKFAKENSLFSFFNAINENYYGFECDVRETKDKKFYIYHDMLYDGKLFKSFNSNEIICDTLESVLKLNTNKIILLEIKDPFIDIDNLVKTLNKYSDKNIYVMSFYNTVIDKLNTKYWYSTMRERDGEHYEEAIEGIISRAKIPIRALLGKSTISVNDFMNIQIGDIIKLDSKVDDELDVYVGNIMK